VNGWKNDPVLVKVAMAAIKAAQDHLVAGGTIQSGNRVTAKVVDFQKQVLALINIYKTLTSVPSRRCGRNRSRGMANGKKGAKKGGGLAAPERANLK